MNKAEHITCQNSRVKSALSGLCWPMFYAFYTSFKHSSLKYFHFSKKKKNDPKESRGAANENTVPPSPSSHLPIPPCSVPAPLTTRCSSAASLTQSGSSWWSSTEKVGSQLAMDAPLNRNSQLWAFLAFRCSLGLLPPPTATPPLSSLSRCLRAACLPVWWRSSLRENRQVGHTVSCSSHALRHTLEGKEIYLALNQSITNTLFTSVTMEISLKHNEKLYALHREKQS